MPNAVAQEDPEAGRTEDRGKDQEAEFYAREPKKDGRTLLTQRKLTGPHYLCAYTPVSHRRGPSRPESSVLK